MKRRHFLKLIGVAPFAPSILFNTSAWHPYVYGRSPAYEAMQDIKWFSLKLKPEHEKIEGAKDWVQEFEAKLHEEIKADVIDMRIELFNKLSNPTQYCP